MFFLLIACAPPETEPGLILMGPDALDAGAALEIDGEDHSSALPVYGYGDEEIWVGLPEGEELQLAPQSGELLQVWLEGDSLLYEVAILGEEIDADAVLVVGAGGERLAEELGVEGEADPAGLWLRAPDLLWQLTDPDLPQVEAIVPLQAAAFQSPGLMLETANLASPSPSISSGVRGGAGFGLGQLRSGDPDAFSPSLSDGPKGRERGQLDAGLASGLTLSPQAMALVGYYRDQDGTEYTLSTDGSLSIWAQEGKILRGFYTMDDAGTVHFYVGAEGPVASFQVDPEGSLYTRGQELTRLEFACIW